MSVRPAVSRHRPMSEIVLAGDLGGTNLRVAAVHSDGRLVHRCESVTPHGENA